MLMEDTEEIIVYLDSHSTINNNIGDLYIDFRSEYDFSAFKTVLNLQNNHNPDYNLDSESDGVIAPSYIHLTSVSVKKRLNLDCYYRLNIKALKDCNFIIENESCVVFGSFDLRGREMPNSEEEEILQIHGPLNDLLVNSIEIEESVKIELPSLSMDKLNKLELYVANVGQANWNEIRNNGETIFLFDCGAPFNSSRTTVNNIWNNHESQLLKNKSTLIISHWDMDHYLCIKDLSPEIIDQCFNNVICPPAKSLMTSSILDKLYNECSLGVYEIKPPTRTKSAYPKMIQVARSNTATLYIGEQSRNINYCGISLFINISNGTASLTGDLALIQCDDILSNEKRKRREIRCHKLVVPHHGGKWVNSKMVYNSTRLSRFCCIISVGKNTYGHPSNDTLKYLKGQNGIIRWRTDIDGDFLQII